MGGGTRTCPAGCWRHTSRTKPLKMPVLLTLAGLLIAVSLYAILVRRRATVRTDGRELEEAMAISNQIGLSRLRDRPRRRADAVAALDDRPGDEVVPERRSGVDRRDADERRRGRGRRAGGDRRRGSGVKRFFGGGGPG
jgi:hypothetical protein